VGWEAGCERGVLAQTRPPRPWPYHSIPHSRPQHSQPHPNPAGVGAPTPAHVLVNLWAHARGRLEQRARRRVLKHLPTLNQLLGRRPQHPRAQCGGRQHWDREREREGRVDGGGAVGVEAHVGRLERERQRERQRRQRQRRQRARSHCARVVVVVMGGSGVGRRTGQGKGHRRRVWAGQRDVQRRPGAPPPPPAPPQLACPPLRRRRRSPAAPPPLPGAGSGPGRPGARRAQRGCAGAGAGARAAPAPRAPGRAARACCIRRASQGLGVQSRLVGAESTSPASSAKGGRSGPQRERGCGGPTQPDRCGRSHMGGAGRCSGGPVELAPWSSRRARPLATGRA
jgi:hypothetical protein